MFALNRETILLALEHMEAGGLHHYDAHCPKCRRANSISHDRMAFPGWREALAEMKKEGAGAGKEKAAKVEVEMKPDAAFTTVKPGPAEAKAPVESRSTRKPSAKATGEGEAARKQGLATIPLKSGTIKKPAPAKTQPAPRAKKPATGKKSR